VLTAVKDKARSRAGLRPSLTFVPRAAHGVSDRDGGMIGLQSNNGIGKILAAQAGMAMAGSKPGFAVIGHTWRVVVALNH
jgi:hypothetical protein